ncbi:pseudouridine synthase family protein [Candidatus Vidania fulgoroideorum]
MIKRRNQFLKKFNFNYKNIIFINDNFLIFNKIGTIKMIPTKNNEESIINYLYTYLGDLLFPLRVLSRLDITTTGLFIFPLNSCFYFKFRKNLIKNILKYYLVISKSNINFKHKKLKISGYLKKIRNRMIFSKKFHNKSVFSKTNLFFVDKRKIGNFYYYLLVCTIVSGKTHQIRCHLLYLNLKILGDMKYGGSLKSFNNLHSWKISFFYKKNFIFYTPPSLDFINLYKYFNFKKKFFYERTN